MGFYHDLRFLTFDAINTEIINIYCGTTIANYACREVSLDIVNVTDEFNIIANSHGLQLTTVFVDGSNNSAIQIVFLARRISGKEL